ncbi:MAG: dethiobiotin synthase [Thermodesulfovibrionia bacterium]|nr:dethiobiotin synthase [Thermodesulfovibrionia bacterium]
MGRGLFITGTDTGVGKTFVTAGILRSLNAMGYRSCPMKPAETGCATRGGLLVPADALKLLEASGLNEPLDTVNPYRFRHALAPSASAEKDNAVISKKKIIAGYNMLRKKYDFTIVEGSGGMMVPLYKKYLFIDLIKDMDIPLIIVARPGLGTINHTLLTLKAARDVGINVIGVILNHSMKAAKDASVSSNPNMIRSIGKADILGEVPFAAKAESVLMKKTFRNIVNNILLNRESCTG